MTIVLKTRTGVNTKIKIMEQKNDQSAASRKAGRKRGEITQTMVPFKCDFENVEWLSQFANKGRYLNELIERDRMKEGA